MRNFAYSRPAEVAAALSLLTSNPTAKLLGGGTNLVDLMRENIEQPEMLIDVGSLPLSKIEALEDGRLRIGATVKNTAVAQSKEVRRVFPLLAQAIVFGASGQIRNMATVGGNLLQRTRCSYFYDVTARCNKRAPGSGCDAIGGLNRNHAILGASDHCIATHPSDMCVALSALDGQVLVASERGERTISMSDFHRLPGDTPEMDTNLQRDELITGVELPQPDFDGRSLYRKVRDRSSYAFALISVAAVLKVDGGKVTNVRLALGGVAHRPWRARRAEQLLLGASANEESFSWAAAAELEGARGYGHNDFKIELARRTIVSVLSELAGDTP